MVRRPHGNEVHVALYDFTGDGFIDYLGITDTHTYFNVVFSTTDILWTSVSPKRPYAGFLRAPEP